MVWSATVKITATSGLEARDQFRQALSDRGLHYSVITEVPFDLDTSGSTTMQDMFRNCYALTAIPEMDTSQVTNMQDMFSECRKMTHVPDMDTGQVTNMRGMFHNCNSMTHAPALNTPQVVDSAYMFTKCSSLVYVPDMDTSQNMDLYAMFMDTPALTDGNVRLSLLRPGANIFGMIQRSGLTREPFSAQEYAVSLTDVRGSGTVHPLVSVTVPAGQVWDVQIEGTVTKASSNATNQPQFRIGTSTSGSFANGASVNFSGTVSSANATIAMVTRGSIANTSFTGTVTINRVVKITPDDLTQARDQLRAALTARGLNYQTVTEIPFGIELVGTGSGRYLFHNCAALTSVPAMDTRRLTSMQGMFQGCSSLTSVPSMNTRSVTTMSSMFSGCSSLTSVSDMDTSSVTTVSYMFYNCSLLTDGNVRLIGRHPSVLTTDMITGSGLTRLPFYDTTGNPI
jgi:surface protein